MSRACRLMDHNRQHRYEIRRNLWSYGAEGLIDPLPGAKGPHPNRVRDEVEKAILEHCLAHPTHGPNGSPTSSCSGRCRSAPAVSAAWSHHGLTTKHERLLGLEEIEPRTTRVRRPRSNGFIECFHRTLLDEHLRVKGPTTWYEMVEEMHQDPETHLETYDRQRPHRGRGMNGRPPYQVFKSGIKDAKKAAKTARNEDAQKAA